MKNPDRFVWGADMVRIAEASAADVAQAAFIRGCDLAVEDARQELTEHVNDPTGYAKALEILREAREIADAARLQAYGEPCQRCLGTDDEPAGQIEAYFHGEWDVRVCPACDGKLRVMPEVNVEAARKRPRERDIHSEREND